MRAFFFFFSLAINGLVGQINLNNGHLAYNKRAEGSFKDQAKAKQIDKAIKFYKLALKESEPDAMSAILKSYYYKGKYSTRNIKDRKEIFDNAKNIGSNYLIKYPNREDIAFWYLSNLGSWAEINGALSSAGAGIADIMKKNAQKIIDINPNFENGGGYLFLGVVHFKTPYIPFLINWPSKAKALNYVCKALNIGNPILPQKVYYAEILYESGNKKEAISILNDVAKIIPKINDSKRVEKWAQIKKANKLLVEYK